MRAELAGAVAGFAATVPMTVTMEMMHRLLPPAERYALPPRQVVDNGLARAGAAADAPPVKPVKEEGRYRGALVAHFGFGTMAGMAYGPYARTRPSHPVAAGIGYGLMVWGSQYLGMLPAAGLLPSAVHQPSRRNALMIVAHVVWGAALGAVADRLLSGNGTDERRG